MNLLKTILSTSVFAIASVALHAQLPAKVESFPVRDVRLTASPFKHAEDMDIRYLLGIDPDRLLAPYLKEAGLSLKLKIIPIGKIQGWTVILADIIYRPFPICMPLREIRRSRRVWII